MQIPASYDWVLGVGANAAQRSRACFSNQATIAAPGGGPARDPKQPCEPMLDRCPGDKDCEYGVISLVHISSGWPGSPNGYAYWAGTSFSAPLIVGLAALALGDAVTWGRISPVDLRAALEAKAQAAVPDPNGTNYLGWGIGRVR